MTYTTLEARQELLDSVAAAADELGLAVALLGEGYEQLDERSADRLEDECFRPVQVAYGRAKRTHTEFAGRHGLRGSAFGQQPTGLPSQGAAVFIARAVEAVAAADRTLAELQDSMLPVEAATRSCAPASRRFESHSAWCPERHASSCADSAARRLRLLAQTGARAQQRRGAVALLAALGPEPVDRGEHVVEADRLAPRHRPARVVEAERQAGVHVVGRAHALADRERRLVHELADDPAEHQARGVGHPLGVQAERVEEALGRLGGGRRGWAGG